MTLKLLKVWACAGSLLVGAAAGQPAPARSVDFVRDVQPILNQSCTSCHGAKSQLGGLRLDSKATAFAGGQSGRAIQPGHAADSLLLKRILGSGEQARMPMGAKPLPPEQIETLRLWIEGGALWPDNAGPQTAEIKKHWAFIPPVRAALPPVSNVRWARSPIDTFILARLEKEKLAPSPEADRITLLRRASLDIIGLPPTPEEVDAFLADGSPNAFEKQVDRLLASPHYGERWGRVWLDAARYADSDGFEKDKARQVWFYRDWVINALNRDLPYDQFIIRQIAGDRLPGATQDDRVATGFLRNSMLNEEGGIDPEQFRMESNIDRMEAIGKGILGVTVQCAQCHNHKFDPVKQEDYYRMMAFINDSHEANISVYTPAERSKIESIKSATAAAEARLRTRTKGWQRKLRDWEKAKLVPQPEWTKVTFEEGELTSGGQKLIPMDDGSLLAQGDPGLNNATKLTVHTKLTKVGAVRLEMLTDPNLPRGGPGRNIKGGFALSEFSVELITSPDAKPIPVKIAKATADINPPEAPLDPLFGDKKPGDRTTGPIAFAIDGNNKTAWTAEAGTGLRNQPRKAVFTFAEPVTVPEGGSLRILLNQQHAGNVYYNNNLGRFRLTLHESTDVTADPVPQPIRDLLAIPAKQRTREQSDQIFSYWRTTVPEFQDANDEIAKLWREYPEGTTQLVMWKRDKPRTTHLLTRGDFLKPGKVVEPGVPSFLLDLPSSASGDRLTFAKWLVDRKHPTTARTFVNRVWQTIFGTGIVATSEDLGTQCEPPSHPELLDWLAVEFMEKGWSMKQLVKLIATSAVYQQSSKVTPEIYSADPYNRLLARGPRFRVDAEVVRDVALQASGLLNSSIGGPSVYPPIPEFLLSKPVSYTTKEWFTAKGADRYRRALYTFRFRSVPYPALQTFDAPSGETACVRRARSNTPLQALTMLNEPMFLETAQALAKVTMQQSGADAEKVSFAFRRCVGRTPSSAESNELLKLLSKEKAHFSQSTLKPELFAGNKSDTPNSIEAAAWTAVARVLLNLDETITKE